MNDNRVESFRLKKPHEIDKMRAAGRILGECLAHLGSCVRAGTTTDDLDREANTFIRDHGCVPGFLGYNGFPKSLCVSVNDEVVHGIPGPRVIEEGDLVSLDCGLILDGWWADSGHSVSCGEPSAEVARLIAITREALRRGIEQARPGHCIGDIGHAVQSYVEGEGYSVVRQYVGHGIGRNMHEPPQVPNYGAPGTGNRLKPGYVLAIEPMVNAGGPQVRVLDDEW
ncbi:MAG TPA: type I methionyl aminopeptidase, partial [Candidatus Sulfotelmatobacter sp.]|nr:type I methionyl aminopeptidase [Candidatus Sulfotelmatobacter sp.]